MMAMMMMMTMMMTMMMMMMMIWVGRDFPLRMNATSLAGNFTEYILSM